MYYYTFLKIYSFLTTVSHSSSFYRVNKYNINKLRSRLMHTTTRLMQVHLSNAYYSLYYQKRKQTITSLCKERL